LVRKLNYLTVAKSDITLAVSIVNQFLLALRTTHLEAVMRILRYLKKAPGKEILYSDYEHTRVAGFSNVN